MRTLTILSFFVLGLVAGCATPVMPTGGPADRTPPELVSSEPATDSVMVRTDRLLLEFSKPIDEASLRQALDIVPEFAAPPRVTVRNRRAEIIFPEPLRDNTTYVVTIGTEMRDLRNNRLPAPITIAFATGRQLDTGQIQGWVQDPRSGHGVPDVQLFAYALADTLATPPDPRDVQPDYRTETDNQGRFTFSYLRNQPFFVVAVEDLNRNRLADPGERFASPIDHATVPSLAEEEEDTPLLPLFITSVDTLPPEPLRVRPSSEVRFALRFTEPIILADRSPDAFAVTDSLSGAARNILDVYADVDSSQIILHTEPLPRSRHVVDVTRAGAVQDVAGNHLRSQPLFFTPSASPDTADVRLIAFEPAGSDTLRTLPPTMSAAVRFSHPPRNPVASERITATTLTGEPVEAEILTTNGMRYALHPTPANDFLLQVQMPDSLYRMHYTPLPADSLGEIAGRVVDAPPEVPVVIEARLNDDQVVRTTAAADGSFLLAGLPAGQINLRVFADLDGSGTWDGGLLAPHAPPEPLRLLDNIRVRARWETEIDTISLDADAVTAPAAPEPEDEPDVEREAAPDDFIRLPGR